MAISLLIPVLLVTTAQPNIVVVMVDDLGWQDTSVPMHESTTPFNARYWTPNLEALTDSGMTFTNAYAAGPVCTPTRTSLMTGQCPGRTHITFWTLHRDQDTSRQHDRLAAPTWNYNGITAEDPTLPGLLRGAGYRTIHAGKAHFGAHDTTGSDPTNLGFDVNIAGHASGAPASYLGLHGFSRAGRTGKEGGSVWDVPGLEKYHGQDIYLTEALTREVLPELDRAVADEQPFFLHFAPYAVHTPIMANKRHLDRYDTLHPREAAYATMIESYDEALGAILDRLDTLGVRENTIIVFTSDNGGLSAHGRGGPPHVHNAPLRSGKGSSYEGGVRVPTVIAWPDHIEPGSRSDVPIVTWDLLPTLLAASGTVVPETLVLDGHDLGPVFDGREENFQADRTIGWNQPHQWGAPGPGIEPFTSIRQGRWKLIYFHDGSRFELYDLETDIGETTDLAAAQPDRVGHLARSMQEWIDETGAQLSVDLSTGNPVMSPAQASP